MLIDNPQVLVDEGWTLWDVLNKPENFEYIVSYPTKEGAWWDHVKVAWRVDTAVTESKWRAMKPHQHPESPLSWYLWVWNSDQTMWQAKYHRTRDIINDL